MIIKNTQQHTLVAARARFAPASAIRRMVAAAVALALAIPLTVAFADETDVVQPGETLSGIADFYGVNMENIESYNGIQDVDLIVAGSKLVIPTGGESGGATAASVSSAPWPCNTASKRAIP